MARTRDWVFTINNYTEEEYNQTLEYLKDPGITYWILGKEVGVIEETPHLQGYVQFKSVKSLSQLKQGLPRAHLEQRKGTKYEAAIYCRKENNYMEGGIFPDKETTGQGRRNDIKAVRDAIVEGKGMGDIIDSVATSYQSLRAAELILKYKEAKRIVAPRVYWFWGATGTGKTRTAYEMFPNAWISGRDLKWWQGYDGHKAVIIDDFRGDFCTFHELLRILDIYPYTVETKGGSRQLLAEHIVITSAYCPEYVYNTREDIGQLMRRIHEIREFRDDQ